ncbi:hypothetical protein [Fusobacterium sp. PH5-44]|uniref:hypothetical protein n=1 Tax=unclassified Fusobacterium TaxID=2648384 RepID=UPI003D24F080
MTKKKLRIEERFKELLKSRIIAVWWGICFIFIISIAAFYLLVSQKTQSNIKLFCIILTSIILILALATLIFSFTRKRKFSQILSSLPSHTLNYIEDLYLHSESLGYKSLGIISKDAIILIKNFFMFQSISQNEIIWIYQKTIAKDRNNQNIPGMVIVTNSAQRILIPGYKVTNFLRGLFPTIYLSIEGSLKHKELQNMFSFDFIQMVKNTGATVITPKTEHTNDSNKINTTAPKATVTQPLRTSPNNTTIPAPKLETSKTKERKSEPLNSKQGSIKKFFIKVLFMGLFFGGIALVLAIISAYPSTGRKVLIYNTILGSVYIIFLTILIVNFLIKLLKRSISKNLLYLCFIGILLLGLKSTHSIFYNSYLDLKNNITKENYFSIRYINYQNKPWLEENSECIFALYPVNGKSREDIQTYNIRKNAFSNPEYIDQLIAKDTTEQLPYLYIKQYENSEIFETVEIISIEQYNKDNPKTIDSSIPNSPVIENSEDNQNSNDSQNETTTSEESPIKNNDTPTTETTSN